MGGGIDDAAFERALEGRFSKVIPSILDAIHEGGLGGPSAEGEGNSRENGSLLLAHITGRRFDLLSLNPVAWSVCPP